MNARQRGWLLPPAAIALAAGILAGRGTVSPVLPLLALALVLAAVFLLKDWLRFAACVACFGILGSLAGCIAFHPSLPEEGDYRVTGIVSGEVSRGTSGQVRVPLSSVKLDGRNWSGSAYWTFYPDDFPAGLLPGKEVSFQASLYHPDGADNPGGYDFRESLLRRGITVGLYGDEELTVCDPSSFDFSGYTASLRHRLSERLIRVLGEDSGRYASALLLGMQTMIPSEDREAFSNLGIAHILSVSGFHTGILVGILACLFRLLRLRQSVRLVLYAFVLFFYAALCGMSQPVLRAALFTLLALEGKILNRPRSGLHLLSAAMILTLLLSPAQITGASFQLSYAAMFGIVWFSPLIRRLNPFRNKVLSPLFRSFLLTLGVQLAILFPQLLHFQRLPLLSFLLNYPATLIFTLLILLDWLVLFLLPVPGLSGLLSAPVSWLTSVLLSGIHRLAAVPGLSLWLHAPDWVTALGTLLILWGLCWLLRLSLARRLLLTAVGALAVVLSLLPAPHTSTEYIQFSVGNADAALLWDRDRVIVVDTGEATGQLSSFLRARRLTPDAVILTHLHTDHAGGLEALIRDRIPVPLIYLPEGADRQQINPAIPALLAQFRSAGTEIRFLSRGDVLPLPSGTFTILWPEKGRVRSGHEANDYSLSARVSLRGSSLLLAGDLSGAYEMYSAVPASLLKAAHHGSASSTGAAFLEAVSPEAVLLSCRRLSRLNAFRERIGPYPVWSTAEYGAVTVSFEENGYTITPWLNPGKQEAAENGS